MNGRVSSLLEVGTGFHPELTGRENIYLNGTILGMSRREVKSKFDEIVAFSGVEKFLDTPVKRYSSGMYVRLAFAVAAHLEPEILIIDEVLAVGDAEFQKKCLGKMDEVAKGGRTVLFVSHNMGAVRQMCNFGVFLNEGLLVEQGNTIDVISKYLNSKQEKSIYEIRNSNKDIFFSKIEVINVDDTGSNDFLCDQEILILFAVQNRIAVDYTFKIIVRVMNHDKQYLFSSEISLRPDKANYQLTIPPNTLTKGVYSLSCIIYKPAIAQYDNVDDCCSFSVINNNEIFSHLEGFNIGSVYKKTLWE
jgi:lipopolysaccharide transport system ATP-binding protein